MMNSKYMSNVALRQYIATISLLVFTLVSVQYFSNRTKHHVSHGRPLQYFPGHIAGWEKRSDFKFDDSIVDILKVDEYINRVYSKDNHHITLYIGNYHSHRKFVEIHTPENCQANSGWNLLEKKEKIISGDRNLKGNRIRFMEELYSKDGKKYLLAYFYKLIDETTTSFFAYKITVIRNSILKNRSDAQFIRVLLPLDESNPSESVQILERFVSDLYPVLCQEIP